MNKSIIAAAMAAAALAPQTMTARGTADLQGVTFNIDTVSHVVIGPGVTQSKLVFSTSGRSFNAFVLDMNADEATNVRVKVDVGRDSCNTAEAITSIAKRKTNANTQYLGGINGDFFITSSFANQHEFGSRILGYPNMSCITEGKIVAPDMIDITSRENALIVGSEGMWIDATDLKYRVLNNAGDIVVDATAVNYPRRDEEMVVYNSYMGKYTKTSPQGRELVLRLADGAKWAVNKSVKFIVDSDWHSGQSAIPADGIVISCGPKYSNDFIDGLKKGDVVKLKIVLALPAFSKLKPNVLEVCGGDVRILKENVTTTSAIRWINTPSAKYSRSLVGYSEDRKHTVMCAVDASGNSSGVTYYEAADVMRALGCWDALDLDGGGSTAIWSHSHGIINNLRDGSERAVGNGLFFVLDDAKGTEVKTIRFMDHAITLPRYAMYRPTVYGYNEQGQLINLDLKNFTLEAAEDFGTVSEDGNSILVTGTGAHTLTARSGDMTATINVLVDGSAAAQSKVPAYILDGHHDQALVLEAAVGNVMMEVAARAYTWSVADQSVVSIDAEGVMKGLANGTTVVTGVLGDSRIEVPVTVEIPASSDVAVFDEWNPADWKITRTSVSSATAVANPEAGGMDVTYKVSSTRGPRVTMANEHSIYSRPDGFSVTLGQPSAALAGATVNLLPANVTRAVAVTVDASAMPAAGEIKKVEFNIGSVIDLDDPAVYPIKFVSLAIVPASKTGDYVLNLRGIDGGYSYVGSGVDAVAVPEVVAEKLICTVAGDEVSLPFTADRVEVYTASGALVATRAAASAITVPGKGMYVVRATLGAKTLSAIVPVK